MMFRPQRPLRPGRAEARCLTVAVLLLAAAVFGPTLAIAAPKPQALEPGTGVSRPEAQRSLGGPEMILPDDLDAVLDIATGYGNAELDKTESGDPVITGDINGVSYQLFFLDCTLHRACRIQNFYAVWDTPGVSLETINDWNRAQPFHKSYLTEDNFPVIELNVSIAGGTSRTQMRDAFDRWTIALAEFQVEVLDSAL